MNKIPRDVLQGWDILVIDDDPLSLDVARRLLKHYGAIVHGAGNGLEALEALQTLHPRFILSDISMPVMDGWALIERLKGERATAEIPVIALTAHAMPGDRERAMAAGFHNYLSKPLSALTFIHDLLNLLTDIPELNFKLPPEA